jgi:hypothetical protein
MASTSQPPDSLGGGDGLGGASSGGEGVGDGAGEGGGGVSSGGDGEGDGGGEGVGDGAGEGGGGVSSGGDGEGDGGGEGVGDGAGEGGGGVSSGGEGDGVGDGEGGVSAPSSSSHLLQVALQKPFIQVSSHCFHSLCSAQVYLSGGVSVHPSSSVGGFSEGEGLGDGDGEGRGAGLGDGEGSSVSPPGRPPFLSFMYSYCSSRDLEPSPSYAKT